MTTIDAERPETKAEVILGVDTHLDFHVTVAGTIWEDTLASRACQRP